MHIDLNDEQLKVIMTKAIVDSLTPEKREQLITKAIASLYEPDSQYDRRSKITVAFAQAACSVAEKMMAEALNTEPYATQIRKVVTDACDKVLGPGEHYDKLVEKVANAVRKGLYGSNY